LEEESLEADNGGATMKWVNYYFIIYYLQNKLFKNISHAATIILLDIILDVI